MKLFAKYFIGFLFVFIAGMTHSQVVYEPLYEDVYNFLGRISQKGIIEFDDLIRPLPRSYISKKLSEADSLSTQLTSLERDELEFFLKDYYHERWLSEGNNKQTEHLDYFGFAGFPFEAIRHPIRVLSRPSKKDLATAY